MKIIKNQKKDGYILLLTLLIISASVAVVTYIFTRGTTYMPFARMVINRQKAKQLALGGIQVVIAQLTNINDDAQEGDESKEKKTSDPEELSRKFLTQVLPVINSWQTFTLKESVDGIDGELKICLMCEDGKIDINAIYDFKNKKFRGQGQAKGDWKKILELLFKEIQQRVGGNDLLPAFEKFLKERQYTLHDVTELLHIKEFSVFKHYQFYEPFSGKDNNKKKKRPIYLTDVFTVQSNKSKLQPWLLSDSLIGLLGMNHFALNNTEERKKIMLDVRKSFKRSVNWSQEWDTVLKPIYEKELHSLPKGIESMLGGVFEPKVFSALIHGTVDKVTQKFLVILERTQSNQNGSVIYDVKINKLYWL